MTRPIVCVGNGVLDQVYEVEALPRAGIKVTALGFRETGGGPAATAAVAIARLGAKVFWWGRVGDDSAGRTLRDAMARAGVDLSGIAVVPGGRTVRAVVMVDKSGERSILVDRTGLPKDPALLPQLDVADGAVLLADTRWPEGSEAVLNAARGRDVTAVLDADGGDPVVLERLAGLCDHIVFSNEGLTDFIGLGPAGDRLRRVASRFPAAVLAVTCGAAGSLWWIGGSISTVPSFPVTPRDTTGCGDVFHGAYALGLAEAMAPLQAARFASAAAALKAARGMGWDGMPEPAAVDEMLTQDTLTKENAR
jgi:sulfofructose kinase